MRRWISWAFVSVTVGGLWAQFGGAGGQERPVAANAVGPVEISERVFTTVVGGRLQPAVAAEHAATVGGIVAEVRVSVGQRVEAGDVLYTVRRSDTAGEFAPVVVSARIAGSVASVAVRAGSEVRSGETGVTVIDTREYLMTALISDKDAFDVQVNRPVVGRSADGSAVPGTLVSRSLEPDYQTGLFTLTFRFPGTATTFPGQFLSVGLPVESVRGIFVSQRLLFRRYGRYYLWSVSQEQKLTAHEVTPGRAHGDDVQIVAGLEPGDRILLQRRGGEREGTPVAQSER